MVRMVGYMGAALPSGICQQCEDEEAESMAEKAPGCPSCYLATGQTIGQRWDPVDEEFRCRTHG